MLTPSLRACLPELGEGTDHFANATVAQSFKTYEGQPLAFPAEAAGPKAEYLEYHRTKVFDQPKT